MAGPVEQVGEVGPCPRCGAEVLLKTTIPILRADASGVDHVCRTCARSLAVVGGVPRLPAAEAPEEPGSTAPSVALEKSIDSLG